MLGDVDNRRCTCRRDAGEIKPHQQMRQLELFGYKQGLDEGPDISQMFDEQSEKNGPYHEHPVVTIFAPRLLI